LRISNSDNLGVLNFEVPGVLSVT